MNTVLVVEDSFSQRECVSQQLTWSGWNVIQARDGVEALQQIQINSPDLVLLDLLIPRIDGYRVCRLIKANPHTQNIPVVLLTGKGQRLALSYGIKHAEAYVGKPWQPRELLDTLKRVLLDTKKEPQMASADTWTDYGILIFKIIQLYECRVQPWTEYGSQMIKLYEKALAAFEKALTIEPDHLRANHYRLTVEKKWSSLREKLEQSQPCKVCQYYHGKDGINCAVYPWGRPGEFCLDWELS
ncbi:MAG: response regulator [Coleofasciculus chthonoplastes F3-SA18-01]|uniref:response regulator n=1 Tax=Coleofasciculus chthonoplastes TaxID=64178 RepID=UPI0032F9B607